MRMTRATVRINYATSGMQILLAELSEHYPDNNVPVRILNAAIQKRCGQHHPSYFSGIHGSLVPPSVTTVTQGVDVHEGREVVPAGCYNLFTRDGEKFIYWGPAMEEVVECEIVSGGIQAGERWFSVNKTVDGQTHEDVVTFEQLEELLSRQL